MYICTHIIRYLCMCIGMYVCTCNLKKKAYLYRHNLAVLRAFISNITDNIFILLVVRQLVGSHHIAQLGCIDVSMLFIYACVCVYVKKTKVRDCGCMYRCMYITLFYVRMYVCMYVSTYLLLTRKKIKRRCFPSPRHKVEIPQDSAS